MIALIIAGLIVLKLAVQFWLNWLNRRHVLVHADAVPEAFKGIIDPATYTKSVRYTLAKSRFGQVENTYDMVVLLVVSGVQTLMLGIVGEYLWRNLEETRRRPRFIVDRIVEAGSVTQTASPENSK